MQWLPRATAQSTTVDCLVPPQHFDASQSPRHRLDKIPIAPLSENIFLSSALRHPTSTPTIRDVPALTLTPIPRDCPRLPHHADIPVLPE